MRKNFNRLRINNYTIAVIVGAVIFFIMYCAYGFIKYGVNTPLNYSGGDDYQWYLIAKTVKDNGWFWHNNYLGAPFRQSLYDFSGFFHMNFDVFIMKIVYLITNNIVITINTQLLLNHALSAAMAFLVLREIVDNYYSSVLGGILYGLAPYIQSRGIGHLCLGAAYFVPLSLLLCVWCKNEGDDYLKFSRNFFCNKKNTISLLAIILIANNGWGYYAVFTCFFLVVTAIIQTFEKSIKSTIPNIKIIISITALFVINMIPTVAYQVVNGNNLDITTRTIAEGEIHGLKISYFFIPTINTHGIKFLEDLKDIYYNNMPLVAENSMGYMGIAGLIGFLISIAIILQLKTKKDNNNEVIVLFSKLIITAIIFATVGGLSGIISIYFHFIRGYNRIVIFIDFMCVTIFVFIMHIIIDKARKFDKTKKNIVYIFVFIMTCVCIVDQIPEFGRYDSILEANGIKYKIDDRFINEIEKELSRGDMIFQLPYHEFPEGGPVNEMSDYQLLTGYIHSNNLRWSYGGVKNRKSDLWNREIASLSYQDMVNSLIDAGFKGIYIDSRAYSSDELKELENGLSTVLRSNPKKSDDNSLIFYYI